MLHGSRRRRRRLTRANSVPFDNDLFIRLPRLFFLFFFYTFFFLLLLYTLDVHYYHARCFAVTKSNRPIFFFF